MPARDVLLERQVELEGGHSGWIALDCAKFPALLVVLEAEVECAASETARL